MKKLINLRQRLKNATAGDYIYFVCFVISVVLLIVAFFTPPPFRIDESVLKAVGLMGIFSTIYKISDWIKLGLDIKFKKGDFELNIENNEENNIKKD